MPYEDMGQQPIPEGTWAGPINAARPPAVGPEDAVGIAREIGGAAYRTQKHSWVPQADNQIAYGDGFVSARTAPYFAQQYFGAEDAVDMPNADSPLGTEHTRMVGADHIQRVTGQKDIRPQHLKPSGERTDVLNTKTHVETTGEDPAPIYRHGAQTGR